MAGIRFYSYLHAYLRDHWQGQHSLRRAFWINFFLLGAIINYFDQFVQAPNFINPDHAIIVVIVYFVICRLIIYPWQVLGLLRTCDRYLTEIGGNLWARAAQGAVFLSFVITLVLAFATFQSLYVYLKKASLPELPVITPAVPDYSLQLLRNNEWIHLSGDFQAGITRDLRHMLQQNPTIKGIMLDSDGGRVYEGRGIAKLILEYELDTYTLSSCKSACTIAFAAGKTRFLKRQAKLGFHQYWLEAEQGHPFINIEAEQQKDRAFFMQQKIDSGFIDKIFTTPHHNIWFPSSQALLEANVVHHLINDID